MFKNILIVGCGLIGSSILRASINKKISKNFFVYEKSKKNIREIKKINKKIIILKKLDNKISDMDFVIIATPMSQYERIILREMNSYGIKNCLRLTIGNVRENILLINQMKKIFKNV